MQIWRQVCYIGSLPALKGRQTLATGEAHRNVSGEAHRENDMGDGNWEMKKNNRVVFNSLCK